MTNKNPKQESDNVIPKGWLETTLREVCEIVGGEAAKSTSDACCNSDNCVGM